MLDLSSGDVDLNNIAVIDDLNLSMKSGDIEINGLAAKSAYLQSSSGDQEVMNFSVSEAIQIFSSSGDITLENMTCSQMKLESTSGDIEGRKCFVDLIEANSTSGDFTLKDLEGAARVQLTSGNIEVHSNKLVGEFSLSSTSGDIKLSAPSDSGFNLDARTTSGDIKCAFNLDNENKKEKELQGAHGDGEVLVTLNTVSGDIRITKK